MQSLFQFDAPMSHTFRGIPGFFLACCHDVKRQNVSAGYDHPAYELMRHLSRLEPDAYEDDEWEEEIDNLFQLIAARHDTAILVWFEKFYPKCLALVPKRRRSSFLQGIYQGAQDFGR